jgi:hypothetical protein
MAKLNELQRKGLEQQLIKEQNALERAKANVQSCEARIAGIRAALQE